MLPAEADRAPGAALVPARPLIAAAALALLVPGCGDEDEAPPPHDPAAGATELELTLDPDGPGGEEPLTATVSCEPGAEDGPCARLTVADTAPIDPQTPCTEIYGGPDELTLEGTVAGEEVSATFTRANGCEIDRFERLVPLLTELFPRYEPGAAIAP